MRPRDLIRAAGLATVALLLTTPATAFAEPATGSLTFYPSDSIDKAAIRAETPAGCPGQADTYMAIAKGHGFPADGQIVTAPTAAGMSHTEGFLVYFAQTMKDFATDNRTTLQGKYDVAVYCLDSFQGTKFAEFTGTLTFTTPTTFKASGKKTSSKPPATAQPTPASAATTRAPSAAASAGVVPEAAESTPATELAAAPASTASGGGTFPIGWIAAGIAAVLLSFEIGRRFGRRSTQP